MALIAVLGLDLLLTFIGANIVSPAAFRFSHYGLPGLLFRSPFYLLRFYIGIAALLLRRQRDWFLWEPVLGLGLTAPLAFWANLPISPNAEPWLNLSTGIMQGTFLNGSLFVSAVRIPLGFRSGPGSAR